LPHGLLERLILFPIVPVSPDRSAMLARRKTVGAVGPCAQTRCNDPRDVHGRAGAPILPRQMTVPAAIVGRALPMRAPLW
jgi:hypothetical protein